MSDSSLIEWTDATWNPITGCALVSEGCRHCYAARLAAGRLKHLPSRQGLARVNAAGEAKFTGEVRFNREWLDQPLRWKRARKVFVCAHGDLFAEGVPDEWIDQVFAVMALAPQHTFQVLTKRPERMRAWMTQERPRTAPVECLAELYVSNPELAGRWPFDEAAAIGVGTRGWPLRNVWLGTSVEDQAAADARIPPLLATPAAVRFISAEPLLGPIDIRGAMWPVHERWPSGFKNAAEARAAGATTTKHRQALVWAGRTFLNWVIAGGESGPGARPMHPDWARSLRDQCADAEVTFFFKQWGEWVSVSEVAGEGMHHVFEDGATVRRVGKKAAGRRLDGVLHDAFPEPALHPSPGSLGPAAPDQATPPSPLRGEGGLTESAVGTGSPDRLAGSPEGEGQA